VGAARSDAAAAAAALFERARQKGHTAACNNLALCYEEGRGVPEQDLDRARVLYEEAAAGGIVVGTLYKLNPVRHHSA
jgi:TPR repeat protein